MIGTKIPPTEPGTTPLPPGVYQGLDEATYHADSGSLSVTGAKTLINDTPAHYRQQQDEGRPPRQVFDFGHAAHAAVLGVGAPVVIVQTTAKDGTKANATDYRSKSAQDHRDAIRAEGKTPLLEAEAVVVAEMAARLRDHPIAAALLNPLGGTAEVSGFWTDVQTGVMRRFRTDWLPNPSAGRLILVDYKTSVTANPRRLPKHFADCGYHMQDDWYREGAVRTGLAASHDDVAFVFIVQEKTAPYLVTVHEVDQEGKRIGRQLNDQAVAVYADCVKTGEWPGYPVGVSQLSLPAWYVRQYDLDEV